MKLCKNDPLLNLLRKTFEANPVKIPEERIQPLTVILIANKKNTIIGDITPLLSKNKPLNIGSKTSQMPSISLKETKGIDTKLGVKIMDGFLKSFGSKGISIGHTFQKATKISFSFQNVHRKYIDITVLVHALEKLKFEPKNPLNEAFIQERAECVVVTEIITSNNFSIKVEDIKQQTFDFDIPEIKHMVSSPKNKIKVTSSAEKEISFEGAKELTFAFKAIKLKINFDGSIYYDNEADEMFLTTIPSGNAQQSIPPSFIAEDDGFFEFDQSQYVLYRKADDNTKIAAVLTEELVEHNIVYLFTFSNALLTVESFKGETMDDAGRGLWSEITWEKSEKWEVLTTFNNIEIPDVVEDIEQHRDTIATENLKQLFRNEAS